MAPATRLGKYQLLRKLATGGMAEVFLAKTAGPMGFEKQLVIKRILPHLAEDPQFVQMFLGEAKLAARLNHPNLVQIFDFGESDGSYFIAMEYIDGPTLRLLLQRAREKSLAIPFVLAARIVSAAAEGLAYAHEFTDGATEEPLQLVHRDVSPDNILISRNGSVKVVDFGIAKAKGVSHHTQTGTIKGKVAYMAPEQLKGEPLDLRVDLYGLGVVLYELVTLGMPYEAASDASLVRRVLYEPYVPPAERRPELPLALQQVFARLLAKDREERYRDCRTLEADLERYIHATGETSSGYALAQLVSRLVPTVPVGVIAEPEMPIFTPSALSASEASPAVFAVEAGNVDGEAKTAVASARPKRGGPKASSSLEPSNRSVPRPGSPNHWVLTSRTPTYMAPQRGPTQFATLHAAASIGCSPWHSSPWRWAARGLLARLSPLLGLSPLASPVAVAPPSSAATSAAASAPTPPPAAVPVVAAPVAAPPEPVPLPAPPKPTPHVAAPAPKAKRDTAVSSKPLGAFAAAEAQASKEEASSETGPARIRFESQPRLHVRLGDRILGTTPLVVTLPAPGSADVELFDTGLGLSRVEHVDLEAGDNPPRKVTFEKGAIDFQVQPGITVYVDGKKVGIAPFDKPVPLYEGKHPVRLVLDGQEERRTLTVTPNETETLEFTFER